MTKLNVTPAGIAAAEAGNALVNNIMNGTEHKGIIYTKSQIKDMRDWVADCTFEDSDEIRNYSDLKIIRGVDRHYVGGVSAFIQA